MLDRTCAMEGSFGDVAEPTVITNIADLIWKSNAELTQLVDKFASKFSTSVWRDTDGRAEQPLKPGAAEQVNAFKNRLVEESACLKLGPDGLKACAPACFGVAKDKVLTSCEKGRAVTIRFLHAGSRQMICASCAAVKEYMESNGLTTGLLTPQAFAIHWSLHSLCHFPSVQTLIRNEIKRMLSALHQKAIHRSFSFFSFALYGFSFERIGCRLFEAVRNFFEKMTKEQADKFMLSQKLFHATVSGPNQGIIVPFNFITLELVSRAGDCVGLKVAVYFKERDEEHMAVNKWLIGSGAPNSALQDAVDVDAA